MEETQIYTFWKLINEYIIEIPIIQRDYAQGRKEEKIEDIRNNFLDTLYRMIEDEGQSVDLDFIYGSIIDKTNILTPLDGQQRLTTLFLLHWYLSIKDNKHENIRNILKKFTYKTRVSSRNFCDELVSNEILLPEQGLLSESIIDKPWFFLSWKKDPTIQSMLTMLDAIHSKFKDTNGFFEKLIDADNKPVTFQFLRLDNFGLSDELYIKMNARGKALTEFENFKARFEQYLEKNKDYKQIFSKNIDGMWTDFFWKHRDNSLIDKAFMRYFYYISEMLYYKKNEKTLLYVNDEVKLNFDKIKEIYTDDNNIDFLFNTLNILSNNNIEASFFHELFNHVSLFDDRTDLFSRCVNNETFGIYEKIIFFTILSYLMKHNIEEPNDNLKDLVRVIRNQLLRVRQQNQTKYNSNLRYENMSKYVNSVIDVVDSNENIYYSLNNSINFKSISSINYEVEKAELIESTYELKTIIHQLEDSSLLQGAIHNIHITNDIKLSQDYMDSFNEIWSLDNNSLLIRALLTIGDFSVNTGWSNLGNKWYFGDGDKWHTILTNVKEEKKLIKIFSSFFDTYLCSTQNTVVQKLQNIIDEWLSKQSVKDWMYYFVKYSEITSSDYNLFTFKYINEDIKSNFQIRNLTKNSLRAWHINPYVKTVVEIINNNDICILNDCCWSKTSDESPLKLKQCELWCMEDGWHVYVYEDELLDQSVINEYNLSKLTDKEGCEYFLLVDTDDKDRIEIAVEFISKL